MFRHFRKGPLVFLLLTLGVSAFSSPSVAASATRLPGFRSPSGNIRCLGLNSQLLLCSIGRADYVNRLQDGCMGPTGAGVDWHGWSLGPTHKAQVVCTGGILYNPDTQRPSYVTLPYGKTWRLGMFTCRSRVSGVTCRNRRGHGLFISRQTWRTW
jgi:hypothetical protein